LQSTSNAHIWPSMVQDPTMLSPSNPPLQEICVLPAEPESEKLVSVTVPESCPPFAQLTDRVQPD
jgi:hypothetical protein